MKLVLTFLSFLLTFSGLSQELPSLVARVDSTIFKVLTYNEWGHPDGTGTGFYTSQNGVAISNWHVLEGAAYAYVLELDGTLLPIQRVIRGCEECDLIEFQVALPDGRTTYPLEFASDPVKKGQDIFIIGCPNGYQNFVSQGIVSAFVEEDGERMFQTEASISPGSSGSPVMNMEGEVVGVATAIDEGGQNLNFVVPVDSRERMKPVENGVNALTGNQQPIFVFHERSATVPNLLLHTIQPEKEKTTVRVSYTNTSLYFGNSAFIFTNTTDKEKGFRLTNRASGKTYNVISSTLTATAEDPYYMLLGETVYFELVFPPLDEVGSVYDLTEGMEGGSWTIKHISLDKPSGMNIRTKQDVAKIETLTSLLMTRQDLEFIGENSIYYLDDVLSDAELTAFEYNLAGVVAYLFGNYGNAERYFNQAIDAAPLFDDPWINQYMLVDDENDEKELRYIEGALKANPEAPEILRLKATVLSDLERYSDAAWTYNQVLKTDRFGYSDYLMLGMNLILVSDLFGCDAIRDGLYLYLEEVEFEEDADDAEKEEKRDAEIFDPELYGEWLLLLENACGKKYVRTAGLKFP
jgi:serine protease Do